VLNADAKPFVPAAAAADIGATAVGAANGDVAGGRGDDASLEAAVAGWPLKQLRARLKELHVSTHELECCLERADLVALLQRQMREERRALATEAATRLVASEVAGVAIELACGCPAPLQVRQCLFSFHSDNRRLHAARAGALWGAQHEFVVDARTTSSVGQCTAAIYEWERRHLLEYAREREGSGGGGDIEADGDFRLPLMVDEDDAAALAVHACVLELGSADDRFMRALLPPNLCCVRRTDAERSLRRLARQLNWPRVRLLFIGQREAAMPPSAVPIMAPTAASSAIPAPIAMPTPEEADGRRDGEDASADAVGCGLAMLDPELLWLIADCLVELDVNDDRAAEGGP